MKKEKFKGVLAALFTAMCIVFYGCTGDNDIQTLEEEKAVPVEFTPEESHYMMTEQKGNSVNPQEAIDRVLEHYGTVMTRGENDLKEVGIIYKEEIGKTAKDTVLPDTLAYMFESKNQRMQYIVSADNRTNESLLAEYNKTETEMDTSQTSLTIKDIIRKGIANHIRNEIISYEQEKDSIMDEIQKKFTQMALCDSTSPKRFTRPIYPHEGDPAPVYQVTEEVLADWHEVAFRDEMIPVWWCQDEPYNWQVQDLANCPSWSYVPTGCLPTAVAQIMTYWNNPLYVESQLVDWSSLTENIRISHNDSIRGNKVATLMKAICIGCNTAFGCGESFSDIESAVSYLETINFNVGSIQSYSSSEIYQSLQNSRPVLITGYNCNYDGHAWNIDGYQRKAKTVRTKTYIYDEMLEGFRLISTVDHTYYSKLFHYNWGWNGNWNGWFAENCFDCTTRIMHPTRNANEDSYEYNVEIVTNIYPNNN